MANGLKNMPLRLINKVYGQRCWTIVDEAVQITRVRIYSRYAIDEVTVIPGLIGLEEQRINRLLIVDMLTKGHEERLPVLVLRRRWRRLLTLRPKIEADDGNLRYRKNVECRRRFRFSSQGHGSEI